MCVRENKCGNKLSHPCCDFVFVSKVIAQNMTIKNEEVALQRKLKKAMRIIWMDNQRGGLPICL